MGAMRQFAASVVLSRRVTGLAARGHTPRDCSARGLPARGTAILRIAVLGLIALIAGTSVSAITGAKLAFGTVSATSAVSATSRGPATSTAPIAGTGPALATVASARRSTLASVVPSTAIPPSRITFAVYCSNASATSATLLGRTLGLTEHIKMRPNRAGGDFTVSVILPGNIQPGTYHPGIDCSDGTSTTARLLVPALGAASSISDGVGTWLAAGGLALLGLGAVTGGIALRRRKRGDPGSLSPLRRWQDQAARSRHF